MWLFIVLVCTLFNAVSGQSWKEIGCYADNVTQHEMQWGPYRGEWQMTPQLCNSFCQRLFKFFALQNGTDCFCGNSYGNYGRAFDCNVTCSGDSSSICGGNTSSNVYAVGSETLYPNGYVTGCLGVSKNLPFCNTSLSIDDRITDLIGRLYLEEKVGILGPDMANTSVNPCNFIDAGISRLGIPPYMNLVETNSAVASACLDNHKCATEFPSAAILAASFNRTSWHLKGEILSTEMRAFNNLGWWRGMEQGFSKICLTGFGPTINIVRDPRFGRNSELPSEDPLLAGSYAVEYTRGSQVGPDPKYLKMISGIKVYALYSVETNRSNFIPNVTTFDLYDTYLPQYKMAFSADQGNVMATMCSYAGANGVPACANDFLLNQMIRQQWGRPDAVVASDCGSVSNMILSNHYATDGPNATAKAINAGLDLDLGDGWYSPISSGGEGGLQDAITHDLTDEYHVDQSLRRVLEKRFRTGQFDPLENQQYAKFWDTDINTTFAHETVLDQALQGLVLLKNNANTLPLPQGKRLAVIGPFIDAQRDLFEDYKGDTECFSQDDSCVRTIAEVFTNSYGPNLVTVAKGVDINSTNTSGIPQALDAVFVSDYVILTLGVGHTEEQEGLDRNDTLLPGMQTTFALEVLNYGRPTIIVLINGGIVSIDSLISKSAAIIEAFNPAMRGAEAIYSAITGASNRWGKLPVTIYPGAYTNQIPMTDFNMTQYPGRTYRYYANKPLFPFGFGLSYTNFSIGATLGSDNVTITVSVKNTGTRAGDEVVMMYHRVSSDINASVDHPVPIKQLVDFNRVGPIQSSDTNNFVFTVTNDKLALTNNDGDKVIYPGTHYLDITNGIQTAITITIIVPKYVVVEKGLADPNAPMPSKRG